MIEGFKHKGLEAFYLTGICKGFRCADRSRLRRVLEAIDSSAAPDDLFLPGLELTRIRQHWAMPVGDGDFVTFDFRDGDALNVDLTNKQ